MNNNTKKKLKQLRKTNPEYFTHKPRVHRKPKVACGTWDEWQRGIKG